MWSAWIGEGLDEVVFWRSTYREVQAVIEYRKVLHKAANLRAGLVASMIYNVNRKKGTPAKTARDFIQSEREYMSVEEARSVMDAWAARHNKEYEA